MLIRRKITSILFAVALVINVALPFAVSPIYAKSRQAIKPGHNYTLTQTCTVYKGPGKEYGYVKRKALKPSSKKHAVKKSHIAKLKKGTVVTCLKVQGNWIKIPSGWIRIN